jgi:hypothetical protein
MGECRYSSTILTFDTRRGWVVSFMPQVLYTWGNHPQYPLDRRLSGPQSTSGCYGEEKNLVSVRKQIQAIHPVAHCYTECTITLLWNPLNDPGFSASTAWAWICNHNRNPFQYMYFMTMLTQFAGLPCHFCIASPLCDLSSAWTGGSPKRPNPDCKEEGALPNQTSQFFLVSGVQCDSRHHYVEEWCVFSLGHFLWNACHIYVASEHNELHDDFLSGQEIIQYPPLRISEKCCNNSSS